MPRAETFLVTTTPDGVVIERLDSEESLDVLGLQLPDLRCVVYRTGGTINFKWQRSLPIDANEADQALADTLRQGYPAYLMNFFESLEAGLPTTYSPDFPLVHQWE
jgi:hypothetical protein